MSSLYIDRRGLEVRLDGEALAFYEKGERAGTVPLAPLERVFLRGDVVMHTDLLAKLGEKGIGVVVLSGRKAEPTLMMARPHNDASRRLAQFQMALDKDFRLLFARCLVERKLLAQKAHLEEICRRDLQHRFTVSSRAQTIAETLQKVAAVPDLVSLRGLEGSAAHEYFAALADILPASLHFQGRNRRPPRDPFNVVLSLGYTLLHSEAVIALYGAGLDPYIGFYHALDYGRESLACDLIEEYRPMVDRFAIECFRDKTLRPEDFSQTDNACLLGKAGRGRFYPAWEPVAEELRRALTQTVFDLIDALQRSTRPS